MRTKDPFNRKWFQLSGAVQRFKNKNSFFHEILTNRPDLFVPYFLVGKVAALFRLSNVQLNIVLDLLVVPLSLFLSIRMFSEIFSSRMASCLAGVSAISIPFSFYFAGSLGIEFPFWIVDYRGLVHSSLPILEGFGTQLGISMSFISTYLLLVAERTTSSRKFFLSGLVSGLTAFCYYHVWMIFAVVHGVIILLRSSFPRQVKVWVAKLIWYFLGFRT